MINPVGEWVNDTKRPPRAECVVAIRYHPEMSQLLLVRHGQASLFTENYDRLSEHGALQAQFVGQHWAAEGRTIDSAYSGTLSRQRNTALQVATSVRDSGALFPQVAVSPDLNEFEAEAVMTELLPVLRERDSHIAALIEQFETASDDSEKYRGLHRLLEVVTAIWVAAAYDLAEVPQLQRWIEFSTRVREAIAKIRRDAQSSSTTAVFTSGGVIAVAVQSALGAPDRVFGELIWRIYNASITEFAFSGERISLDGFNAISHIPAQARTYR